MEYRQYVTLAVLLVLLLQSPLAVRSAVIKRRKRKERDFTRKLETVLKPKETVKVICPQGTGHCVLTDRRLLFDTRAGFQAVPLGKIKKLQGTTAEGKATVSPPKMKTLTIKAETDFVLQNTGEEFIQLVKLLKEKKRS